MLRLRRAVALLLAVLPLLALAPPAGAATTAKRFADVFERATSAMRAKTPELEAALDAIEVERCIGVLPAERIPERELDRFSLYFYAGVGGTVYRVVEPVFRQIADELDALPLRDPTLRAARAMWRRPPALIAELPSMWLPCAQMEAWAASGYKASHRPLVAPLGRAGELIDLVDDGEISRAMDHAVRRLRRLGVSRYDAERVGGYRMLDVAGDVLEKRFERVFPDDAEEF